MIHIERYMKGEAMERRSVFEERKRRLRVLSMIAALMAVTMIALCVSMVVLSVRNQKLSVQLQEEQQQMDALEAENQKLRDQLLQVQEQLAVYNQIEAEDTEPVAEKYAYLTFDDGPHANTDVILDILKTYRVPATFFVNGRESSSDIATYKRIVNEGHLLANHTYSHEYKEIYASVDAFMADVYRLEEMLLEEAEISISKVVRFPGGSNNLIAEPYVLQGIKDTLKAEGYRYFDWNVSGEDAIREGVTAKEIYDEVIRTTKGKETPVILLHSASLADGTINALPDILDYYLKNGYVFRTLDEENAPEVVLALISEE